MGKVLNITSHSEQETLGLAEKLGVTCFLDRDVLVLTGSLGSGKTVFVRGLARGLGLNEREVNSPSFTFVNEYHGERPLYHFDLYRLGDVSELREIGWDDYLSREGIIVVEWGERAAEVLPERYYRLNFKIISDEERQIDVSFADPRLEVGTLLWRRSPGQVERRGGEIARAAYH